MTVNATHTTAITMGLNKLPEEIVPALNNGDEYAFNSIYDYYYQRLYFFAQRFVTPSDAEDIVSVAFISLWEKRSSFSDISSIQHFLFVLIRNRCFNLLKHEAMKLHKQPEIIQQLELSDEEDLHLEYLQARLIEQVYAEVEKLPAKMRTIFLLSFRDGLKPAEIAIRLQLNVQTVSNQKVNAIRLIRAALGDRAMLISLILLLASEQ